MVMIKPAGDDQVKSAIICSTWVRFLFYFIFLEASRVYLRFLFVLTPIISLKLRFDLINNEILDPVVSNVQVRLVLHIFKPGKW